MEQGNTIKENYWFIYKEGVATCCKECGIASFSHFHAKGSLPKCPVVSEEAIALYNQIKYNQDKTNYPMRAYSSDNFPTLPEEVKEWDWEKEVLEYFKKNAMGQVCECGGGGTDKENMSETCKTCGGCGIYNWEVYNIKDFINSVRTSAIRERDAEIVEMIKSLHKDNTMVDDGIGGARCKECRGQESCDCGVYNEALDDIINSLSNSRRG